MNTLHQQMPILRVTYTSQEMQRVAGFTFDDIIINTTPTCNSLGMVVRHPNQDHPMVEAEAVAVAMDSADSAAAILVEVVAFCTTTKEIQWNWL